MQKRISRIQAATEVLISAGFEDYLKDKRLRKVNGSIDPYSIYHVPGLEVAVVTKEWQLPKGNWEYLNAFGRYLIYRKLE